MLMNGSDNAKCATPAAEKISPRGTGHVKSRQTSNHPSGNAPSTTFRPVTQAALPAAMLAQIKPKHARCVIGSLALTNVAGFGRLTSSLPLARAIVGRRSDGGPMTELGPTNAFATWTTNTAAK